MAAASPQSFTNGDLQAPLYPAGDDFVSYDVKAYDFEKDDAMQLLLAFGPAFAREARFWKSFVYSFVLGGVM